MKKTIREEVILELVARAASIRSDGSPQAYNSDCGLHVLRSRPKVGEEELPCIVIWPQVETTESGFGRVSHEMPVQIDAIRTFGSSDPQVIAEQMYGDLVRCFADPAWNRTRSGSPPPENFFDSIVHHSGGAAAPEDGSVTVGATARFIITYWTATGDPYTQ